MKTIKLALKDFSLPAPRTGSIEANSGFGNTNLEGIELHIWAQRKKAAQDNKYKSEIKIKAEFERENYRFVIDGRMDGFYDHKTPHIEEIKSTFDIHELAKVLETKGMKHPYCLQVLSYGYIYYLKHGVIPKTSIHLISTRNKETLDIEIPLDTSEFEAWLELRLSEMVKEAILSEKRVARRKKLSKNFPFPFEKPRLGQMELVSTIEEGFTEKKRMMLQAPTGLGKTVGVLYPSLKEAFARGQKVIYTTPKNSQHLVAEEGIEKFQELGVNIKSLTLTAKSKLCMKTEAICNPEFCEYAKDYYDKLAEHDLAAQLAKKRKLNSKTFKKLAEQFTVCPFELQLEGIHEADTVICDYNYVFGNRSVLSRLPLSGLAQEGNPNLVIDEAHNLPMRAMDYYSPSLSSYVLEEFREKFLTLPKTHSKLGIRLLDDCLKLIRESEGTGKIEIDPVSFMEMEENLKSYLSAYLSSDIEIKPQDPVLALNFYWSEFTSILLKITEEHQPEFFMTFQKDRFGGSLKIICCNAAEMLKEKYSEFQNVVSFSATLKPFTYYAELSGLDINKIKTAEFASPFEKKKRKILIIPQVSTKYSERHQNYSKVAEVISRVLTTKKGNYLAFFGSFDFLENTLRNFKIPDGYKLIKQTRGMKNQDVERVLNELKSADRPIILFAVQGGVFSEGVDYPRDMAIGAFVVGPPLPQFNPEREMMKDYYQDHYRDGFNYAYTYSAMAKAIQSAGRIIRTEEDRGVLILLDDRFLQKDYREAMPKDWFVEKPQELVSMNILKDIESFWTT